MSDSIYDRIVKLLRLAQRSEGNEAELALMHAQRLATENQVDLATIDTTQGEQVRKEEFIKDEVEYSETSLSVYIQWLLQNHFRVKTCYNKRVVFFVGRKSDVVFAQFLFGWLTDRFMSEWQEEKKRPNTEGGRRSSKAFFYGMYKGLDEKLREAKRQAERDKLEDVAVMQTSGSLGDAGVPDSGVLDRVTAQYQLAVVNEKDELLKEYYRAFPNTRGGGSSRSRAAGMAAGRAAGARTSIPGIPLNNSSRSALS
jgi:hypothetical protein